MFFKNACVLVLWTKIASAFEGLSIVKNSALLPSVRMQVWVSDRHLLLGCHVCCINVQHNGGLSIVSLQAQDPLGLLVKKREFHVAISSNLLKATLKQIFPLYMDEQYWMIFWSSPSELLSMGVCTTRHWQTSSRLVQELNICIVLYRAPCITSQ